MSSYLSYRVGLARIDDLRRQADQLRRARLGSVELEEVALGDAARAAAAAQRAPAMASARHAEAASSRTRVN